MTARSVMVGQSGRPSGINPQALVFVGREREQDRLRGLLSNTLASHGGLVLISGEAGIGKTALVGWLAARAEDAGALVVWGHAYDFSVTPPYGPWLEIARHVQRVAPHAPLPAFLDDPDALAALGSQERLFAEVTAFFTGVADQGRLVLILDDLHWADQASLDLLRHLTRTLASHPLLVLATYRSDELVPHHPLSQLLPLLVREAGAERLALRPLEAAAQRELVASRYSLADADLDRLAQYLHAHAEGNPLYTAELLRTLENDEVLVECNGTWRLGALGDSRVPSLLLQVIEGRLRRLNDGTRSLLQLAAVIGQSVPLDLWQRVSGAGDEALADALEQGLEAHVLVETPGGGLRFSHALERQALYERAVLVRRRLWHRQVAEALEASALLDPDAVAYHYQQAGNARSGVWLVRAGERAQRAYAWATALARFESALAVLTERGASSADQAVLLSRMAFLQRWLDPGQALALSERAKQLAVESGQAGLVAFCLAQSGQLHCHLGEIRLGLAGMADAAAHFSALSEAERSQPVSLLNIDLGSNEGRLALWLAHAGRLDEAISLGERMVADAPPDTVAGESASPYADSMLGLAVAQAFTGQQERARQSFQQTRAVYSAIEHHVMVAYSCLDELELLQLPYAPDMLEARVRLAAEGDAAALRATGALPEIMPSGYPSLALRVLEGTWHEAREVAAAIYGQPVWPYRVVGGYWLARIARYQGDVDLVRKITGDLLPDGPRTEPGDTFLLAALLLQRLAADLALDARDLPSARAWLEAHDRWLGWSGSVLGRAEGALLWARYHHVNGDRAPARQQAELSLTLSSSPRQPLALLAAHRFLGRIDTEERRYPAAEEHLSQSLALAESCAAPFERAQTLLDLVELRQALGPPSEAGPLLAEARTICESLGARSPLRRVEALLSNEAPVPRPSYPGGLTSREVEVLRLVAEGLTDPEVAERLFLSRRTVGTHLTSIYTKLGVNSRAAATRFAVEHRLV